MKILSISNGIRTQQNFQIEKTKRHSTTMTFAPQLSADTISFRGQKVRSHTDREIVAKIGKSLSTSTSGHRAIWGSELFNPETVKATTIGAGLWALENQSEKRKRPLVLVGGDTREATRESLTPITNTLTKMGVDVLLVEDPVATPVLALAAKKHKVDLGILLTASHNDWEYGGYNFLTKEAAIAPAKVTEEIAEKMLEATDSKGVEVAAKKGKVKIYDPYKDYKKNLDKLGYIDWNNIRNANIAVYYDGIGGTGTYTFPRLLKDNNIPFTEIKDKSKSGPNPVESNLQALANAVRKDKSVLKIGLANDGDSDRFGIIDEDGEFITPDDVLLLTAHHLRNNKFKKGDIIVNQATSGIINAFADRNGLEVQQTPVGFKYIGEEIIDRRKNKKDILLAGEESGGLTVKGNIPEKDGIIAIAMMMDLVATEKKPLGIILADIKKDLGKNYQTRLIKAKLRSEEEKQEILEKVKNFNKPIDGFEYDAAQIRRHKEEMLKHRPQGDGFKFIFKDGSFILVRASGTEPLIKAYVETSASSKSESKEKIKRLENTAAELIGAK